MTVTLFELYTFYVIPSNNPLLCNVTAPDISKGLELNHVNSAEVCYSGQLPPKTTNHKELPSFSYFVLAMTNGKDVMNVIKHFTSFAVVCQTVFYITSTRRQGCYQKATGSANCAFITRRAHFLSCCSS